MARNDNRERALEAARICFRRWGVDRTKMDDIAREASMSRPALYQYFENKGDIIRAAVRAEVQGFQDLYRRELPLEGPAQVIILERLVRGIERSMGDEFVRSLLASRDVVAGISSKDEEIIGLERQYWFPLLAYAIERGEVRPDLDPERTIRWLLFLQESVLHSFDTFGSVDEVRSYFERYVVPALTNIDGGARPRPTRKPSARRASPATG